MVFHGGGDNIVGSDNVRPDRLHREKLAGRHLLESGGMEDVIGSVHNVPHRIDIAHVSDVELHLAGVIGILSLQRVAHPVLLLFVTAYDADFPDVRSQEVLENR